MGLWGELVSGKNWKKIAVISVSVIVGLGVLAIVGVLGFFYYLKYGTYKESIQVPEGDGIELIKDDSLADKKETPFNPDLIAAITTDRNSKKVEINKSAAVLNIDAPESKDPESELVFPSYAQANKSLGSRYMLPSVNLIVAKSKEIDLGVVAAINRLYVIEQKNHDSKIAVIKDLYERSGGANGEAAPFLAAGLQLGGVTVDVANKQGLSELLSGYDSHKVQPLGAYAWNKDLQQVWDFVQYFKREFPSSDPVPVTLAKALSEDPELKKRYTFALSLNYGLSNPKRPGHFDLSDPAPPNSPVSIFPMSGSHESQLIQALFPDGIPPNVSIMNEMIRRIRSGEIDLTPRKNSGWYDYQVYALEVLLRPEIAQETNKLVLSKLYKERLIGAFKSLITQQKETQILNQLDSLGAAATPVPELVVYPGLRLEPCCTLYLRYARSYDFALNFLRSTVGDAVLKKTRGLKKDGERKATLFDELKEMRDLFYGLYVVSAQDIGLKTNFLKDEDIDVDSCGHLALRWLNDLSSDPDLQVDTRVIVPIAQVDGAKKTRQWATVGIRLAKLKASFAKAPKIRFAAVGKGKPGEWKEATSTKEEEHSIAVEEFAEVDCAPLTRDQFRSVCDKGKTKKEIIKLLQ